MSNDITLEQIKDKLVPVLQKMSLKAIGTRDRELEDIYTLLSSLFLDISVAADHNKPKDPRETQFMRYAELLMEEIKDNVHIDSGEEDIYSATQCIARHAYDLVKHTIEHIDPSHLDMLGLEEAAQRIPDFAVWNEE